MYRKRWNVSAWDVALEIASYWHGMPEQVRVYKDPSLGPFPWVVEVTHGTYGAGIDGWERVA